MQSWPALVLLLLASNSTHSIGQLSSTAPTENAPMPPVFVFNEILMISRELIETLLKIFPTIAPTSDNLTTDERSPLQQPSQTQQVPPPKKIPKLFSPVPTELLLSSSDAEHPSQESNKLQVVLKKKSVKRIFQKD